MCSVELPLRHAAVVMGCFAAILLRGSHSNSVTAGCGVLYVLRTFTTCIYGMVGECDRKCFLHSTGFYMGTYMVCKNSTRSKNGFSICNMTKPG